MLPSTNAATVSTERLWRIKMASKHFNGVTDNQRKQLARSGQLKPNHELCLEGEKQWFKTATVKGLFPVTPNSPPVPPAITAEIVSPRGRPEVPMVVHLPVAIPAPSERITFAGVKKFTGSLLPCGDRASDCC